MYSPVNGMICIWCYHLLPVENFKYKHKDNKYFKTCNNCRNRPIQVQRTPEWKMERIQYNCGCGTVLNLVKKESLRIQQLRNHEATNKHAEYLKNKDNYEEYIKTKKENKKKRQSECSKRWRDKQKQMY